jgi:hypothetical protein
LESPPLDAKADPALPPSASRPVSTNADMRSLNMISPSRGVYWFSGTLINS